MSLARPIREAFLPHIWGFGCIWTVSFWHKRASCETLTWSAATWYEWMVLTTLKDQYSVRRPGPEPTGSMTRTRGRSTRGRPVTGREPGWKIWTNHLNYLEKDSPTQNQMENVFQKLSLYDWPSSTLNISNIFSGEKLVEVTLMTLSSINKINFYSQFPAASKNSWADRGVWPKYRGLEEIASLPCWCW